MESGTFYWQPNGNDEVRLSTTITSNDYILKTNDTPSQEQVAGGGEIQTTSTIVADSQVSNSPIYQLHDRVSGNQPSSDPATTNDMSIELSNPDAIEPRARTYTCRICQMTFPNKSAVTVHSRLHTDHQGKPFRCSFCEKSFSTNFYLKQHERIHSGQKPYKCPMCEQSFKQLSHVQQHVRTHTGVRPYKCHWPGCGKAFLQQSHLKSHEARHTPKSGSGEKPYKCHWPDCGKSFAQLTNLKSHVARHTPGKGRGKRGASNKKKLDEEKSHETRSPSMSMQDVINQAAAAADIVPGSTTSTDDGEIRPYLCPGCSKVYVREATFKKHLEECKTKLQLSISATASALGIDPPADPMAEYNQVINLHTSQGQPAAVVKEESKPNQVTFTTKTVAQNHDEVQGRNALHVKTEAAIASPVVAQSEQNYTSSSYDLDQVSSSNSITVKSPLPSSMIQYDNRTVQIHSTVNDAASLGAQQVQQQDPYMLADAHSQGLVIDSNAPTTSSGQLTETSVSEHSTINQAAIRWQWDQPVPRLNFP